ncbi:MAG: D-alanyl-D-alanine carboxypeptidase [Rickettsiales bacterium]|nr:D-alanyl-D-alanine carboxypeptidase [Rickettsiales bacterium]
MKKLLAIATILFSVTAQAAEEGCGKNYSAVVFEEKTGDVLFQKRAEAYAYPASLVKMMTLYLTFEALEKGKLKEDQLLTVSDRGEEIARVNKSNTLRLKAGGKISVRTAIEAVIVKSFNEAAVTLAEGVAGSEWQFAQKMNEKALQLGMTNSSFRNASGLHEEGQYTTAFDLARLSKAIKKDFPKYYPLFALKKFSYLGTKYETHNHVLVSYKGAEGMKTGFTNASGFNLISAAKKRDDRVISILTGCASVQRRDKATKKLLDDAFEKIAEKKWEDPENQICLPLSSGFNYGEDGEVAYEDEMMFGEAQ